VGELAFVSNISYATDRYAHTSYLLISSISSSIWCSVTLGGPASPCSAVEIAEESLEEKEGRCWTRDKFTETEDDREFMALIIQSPHSHAGKDGKSSFMESSWRPPPDAAASSISRCRCLLSQLPLFFSLFEASEIVVSEVIR